ncbi:LCP family protein [Pseudonocardia nigra]|uniref:LCP family protein n=1 Tax=Pseudonocardia nigra TaxID=1921578 RepID=UPI001C5F891F|nr:LCP family protein [Pseudonocardia nigra]
MGARRTLGVVARSLVALASVTALAATGLAWTLQQQLGDAVTSDTITDRAPVAEGEAFTALLVGLDARTDANGDPLPPALLEALHAGPDEGQLHTDTIILLHVPAEPGAPAEAISIPRDSYVEIAGGRGTHKINSAYRRGLEDAEEALAAQGITGADLNRRAREAGRRTLIATVEELTGVDVDHFAEINLAGFVELTEALGGVPVCLNAPARDSYTGLDLPAGPQTVTGAGALAFVRQRHGLADGDLDRIARQQAFIAGLAQQLWSAGTFTDPARLQRLVGVVTDHVVLDRGWDLRDALAQLGRLSGADLTFRTIPTGRPRPAGARGRGRRADRPGRGAPLRPGGDLRDPAGRHAHADGSARGRGARRRRPDHRAGHTPAARDHRRRHPLRGLTLS